LNNGIGMVDWAAILSVHGGTKNIKAGQSVVFQGDKSRYVGFVVSGRACASVSTESGQDVWIQNFEAGDFFGHIALLTDKPIDFEIMADTPFTAIMVPAKVFDKLLSGDAVLSLTLAKDLARRLHIMTNRLIEAVSMSSPGRVCAELLRLASPVGVDPDKLIVRPNPVFVELACRVSSSRETVSRTISDLQKCGILSREPGALLIHKPEALQRRMK